MPRLPMMPVKIRLQRHDLLDMIQSEILRSLRWDNLSQVNESWLDLSAVQDVETLVQRADKGG